MRTILFIFCYSPLFVFGQVLFDADSAQSIILKEKIKQYGVVSISKSKVLYNGKKPGFPSLIVTEKYGPECDTTLRFQNNKLQISQVRCSFSNSLFDNGNTIQSTATNLNDGRESMRVDTYLNNHSLKIAEYSIHFQQDTIRKELLKYDTFGRIVWHSVQNRFEQHIFRWQYDSTGTDTLRVRYYLDGILTETSEIFKNFDATGYYSSTIVVNGIVNRTTEWMLDGRMKTDILFNPKGDTLTKNITYSNSFGLPYMEITYDFEFNTQFTLYSFYDKQNRIIGQLGVEGQNVEDPKLNWRIKYDRKGREKEFNRLNSEGKVVYAELNKFNRNGFLLQKKYINRDGKTYLEDRYNIKYR